MGKILNEELNYMKYLLGYKKGIVISEQEVQQQTTNTPQQTQATNNNSDDGCKKIVASGKFSATKADSTEHLKDIITKLDSQIKADPLFANGGLVTNLRLIGGASNYNGGKVTNYTLNNDYTPVASQPTLTDNDKNNMKYAEARANAAKQPVIDELEKLNLTIQGEPKIEAHIINTNGKTDEKNTSGNPGQIVMIEAMICPLKQERSASREEIDKLVPLKPKLIPTTGEITNTIENLIECYENSEIKIYYGDPRTGHYCNKALYSVYANGILLKRADGKDYASLNNVGDAFDDAEIIKGERKKSCGRLNRCGRSNTFTLDRITNESFFNKDVLYKHNGGLVITAACVDKGQGSYGRDESDCHTDVGDISFKIKGAEEQAMEASETPNKFNDIKQIAKFDACKTFKLQVAK